MARTETKIDWKQIKDTPTTVSGYGITDAIDTTRMAAIRTEIDAAIAALRSRVGTNEANIELHTNELLAIDENIDKILVSLDNVDDPYTITAIEKQSLRLFYQDMMKEYSIINTDAYFWNSAVYPRTAGSIGTLFDNLRTAISNLSEFMLNGCKIFVEGDSKLTIEGGSSPYTPQRFSTYLDDYLKYHYKFWLRLYTDLDEQIYNLSSVYALISHTHGNNDITAIDASKITTGTIDMARLPAGTKERLFTVDNQAARYALTTDTVQNGDTVQQEDTGVMYRVVDDTKLDSADGYKEYTAGLASAVNWTGVLNKPDNYPPSSHIHGNITNDGKIGITANKPLITSTGGEIVAGEFGNTSGTFCAGDDSRLLNTRDPNNHASNKVTAMTGYEVPSSVSGTGAIETTDTLNEAVGKLEYKVDTALVNNQATQTQLDNLQVGGRNLLTNTERFSGDWVSGNSGSGNAKKWQTDASTYKGLIVKKRTDSWYGLNKEYQVEAGKTYTFSVYIKATDVVSTDSVGLYIKSSSSGYATLDNDNSDSITSDLTSEFKRFSFTFKCVTSGGVRCRVEKGTSTGTIYICGYKLEEGNQATTWTPAPEDVDADISTAQSTANTAVTNAATAQTTADTATTYATKLYGTCSTAAGTAAKVVTLSGFELFTGATISVKFDNENTASNPTLNVNNTGDKPIYAFGAAVASSYYWIANQTVIFVYNGTQWEMAGGVSSGGSFLPLTGGTLTGNITTKSINPDVTDTEDVGTQLLRYRYGHFKYVCFTDNIMAEGTYNNSTYLTNVLSHSKTIDGDSVQYGITRVSGDEIVISSDRGIKTRGDLIPYNNNTYDIGQSDKTYKSVYATNLYQGGNAVLDTSDVANLTQQQIASLIAEVVA